MCMRLAFWHLIDESIVMKLMMSSKKGMRGLYIEREQVAAPTTLLWHSNGSGKAST
jgi:hypothetical protein